MPPKNAAFSDDIKKNEKNARYHLSSILNNRAISVRQALGVFEAFIKIYQSNKLVLLGHDMCEYVCCELWSVDCDIET